MDATMQIFNFLKTYSGIHYHLYDTFQGVRPVRQSAGNDDDRLIHNGKKNDSFKYHGINLMDLVSTL